MGQVELVTHQVHLHNKETMVALALFMGAEVVVVLVLLVEMLAAHQVPEVKEEMGRRPLFLVHPLLILVVVVGVLRHRVLALRVLVVVVLEVEVQQVEMELLTLAVVAVAAQIKQRQQIAADQAAAVLSSSSI